MTWDEFKDAVDIGLERVGLDGSANLTGIDLWVDSEESIEIIHPPANNERRVFLISWTRDL